MTTTQGLTNLVVIASVPETSEIQILAFRDYEFVDHVELIPPSQLLRLPSHPPGRSVPVDYPELRLAPRILTTAIATTSTDF